MGILSAKEEKRKDELTIIVKAVRQEVQMSAGMGGDLLTLDSIDKMIASTSKLNEYLSELRPLTEKATVADVPA